MGAIRNLRTTWAVIRTVANWPTYYAAASGLIRRPLVVYRLRNGLSFEARPRTLDTAVLKLTGKHRIRVEQFEIDGYSTLKVELKPKG